MFITSIINIGSSIIMKSKHNGLWVFFRAAIGARRKEDTEGFRRSIMDAREAPWVQGNAIGIRGNRHIMAVGMIATWWQTGWLPHNGRISRVQKGDHGCERTNCHSLVIKMVATLWQTGWSPHNSRASGVRQGIISLKEQARPWTSPSWDHG